MRVGVVGATGYVGAELVRWILGHPTFELAAVMRRSGEREPLADVVPGLAGCTDVVLQPFEPAAVASLDAVFLATPHGTSRGLAEALATVPVLVDCAADHRHDPAWVYGQPELAGERLFGARRVAAPGCFATALELALGPLVAAGVVTGPACVAAATGSTGSGATAGPATHHPERSTNLRAYKVLSHQHAPEVRTFLATLGDAPMLRFVPSSAPVDRGIFATAFVPVGDASPVAIVRDTYASAPLVRLREGSPELRHVRGTAFADVAVHHEDDTAVVLVALDNLGTGAASQAVQCLNLAMGLDQAAGLLRPGSLP